MPDSLGVWLFFMLYVNIILKINSSPNSYKPQHLVLNTVVGGNLFYQFNPSLIQTVNNLNIKIKYFLKQDYKINLVNLFSLKNRNHDSIKSN
jgi:hypothetical protein